MKKLIKTILSVMIVTIVIFIGYTIYPYNYKSYAAGNRVDVIDSIQISEENNANKILAEWMKENPHITTNGTFTSAQLVQFKVYWSINESQNVKAGDYFTIDLPDVFDHSKISTGSGNIKDASGNITAVYSINGTDKKSITITFTEYVEKFHNVSGDYWCRLYVADVDKTKEKLLAFVINGNQKASGAIEVDPKDSNDTLLTPSNYFKWGNSSPKNKIGDYYYFIWNIWINMEFGVIDDLTFEDIIPENSHHTFVTTSTAQKLGIQIPDNLYKISVREYIGAEKVAPEDRYNAFLQHYNNIGGYWYSFLDNHFISNGLQLDGIDGGNGISVSNFNVTDKAVSFNLGKITRPILIEYYTIATIPMDESMLGDSESVKLFENTMFANNLQQSASLRVYQFNQGGSAMGNLQFNFTKTGEDGIPLQGAQFSLHSDKNCETDALRISESKTNGDVSFYHLQPDTYYIKEISSPSGYMLTNRIFKVDLSATGIKIYDDKDKELSEHIIDNQKISSATEPPLTEPPDTEPPITEPPTTKPSITEPPITEPSATEPPTTKPSVTNPPTIKPLITKPPTTQSPTIQPTTRPKTEDDQSFPYTSLFISLVGIIIICFIYAYINIRAKKK